MNQSNKQLISVIIFIIFIVISIVTISVMDSGSKKESKVSNVSKVESNTQLESNKEEEVPNVSDSKPIKVVTSNRVISNENSSSSSSSNKGNSGAKSNKNNIPVSYFITELQNNKIYEGGTTKVSVIIKPDNATVQSVKYSSNNTSIARVSSNGIITGISPGVCTITIEVEGGGVSQVQIQVLKKATTQSNSNTSNQVSNSVSNSNIAVTSISLNKTFVTLNKSRSDTLVATISPSYATNKSVMWSSSNSSIVSVSAGKITALDAGKATITAKSSNGKTATCTVIVNGWTNDKKNYYRNGNKVTNTYIDYIYIDGNGNAQAPIGNFNVTLYGARAWATEQLNITQGANGTSQVVGKVPEGGRVKIIGAENNGYLKIQYGNNSGYVSMYKLFINLPDVIPGIVYNISNANSSVFTTAGKNISNVTGKNLYSSYGYKYEYNEKISRNEYYAPLLYPVAVKLQKAYNSAVSQGYKLKIYDTYRPRDIEELVTRNYKALYDSDSVVRHAVDYDKNGTYWGYGWFMTTTGTSRHCQGIAIDLALTDSNGNELAAQSKIHILDTTSVRKYNNANANKLSSLMTGAGFSTLDSEWWHYEDNTYKANAYETFKLG